jgi:thioesterase domain-containing protein
MKLVDTKESRLLTDPLAVAQQDAQTTERGEGLWDGVRGLMRLQQNAPPLRSVTEHPVTALSFHEERLWSLWQMQPNGAGMNLPFIFYITGDLNLQALQKALERLIHRHDVLRTTFPLQGDHPIRVVAPTGHFALSVVEGEDEPEGKGKDRLTLLATTPFDLEHGPLMRVQLVRLAPTHFVLSLTFHHIIFDGWSESILFKELAALYKAQVKAEEGLLKPLSLGYHDYAHWQHRYLQGEMKEVLVRFWQAQFQQGLPSQRPPLQPKPLAAIARRRSDQRTLVLSQELTLALKAFSRKEGATLFATLLTAFKLLFFRYTDQESLFVCTPVATRNRTELKGLLGYFINLLILHTDLSGQPTFRALLQRVRQAVSGAFAHQDLPFQALVQQVGLSRAPLAQVMFVLQNYPQAHLELEGLEVERREVDNGVADFDFFIAWIEQEGALQAQMKFNADAYEAVEIERFLGQYHALLQAILLHPEARIDSQDLLKVERVMPRVEQEQEQRRDRAIPPRNHTEQQLQLMWQHELGHHNFGVTDSFFEVGGNSLIALQIFNQIRAHYGKDLPLSTLFECATIERLAQMLGQETLHQSAWASLVPIQPLGHNLPIFCIHPVRGNILCYRRLSHHLGSNQPFYGLQAQGLDGKQPPLHRIENMAAKYIKEIRTVQPNGPYRLAGYSLGGMVAFEMAQQLQEQGQQVSLLALFDTYGHKSIVKMKHFNTLSLDRKVRLHWKNTVQLNPKKQLAYVFEKIRQRVQKLLIKLYLRLGIKLPASLRLNAIHDAGLEAAHTYVPRPYPGRLVLFRATKVSADPTLGWDGLAMGGIEVYDVPGKHNTIETEGMLTEPHVSVLAEKLKACLS